MTVVWQADAIDFIGLLSGSRDKERATRAMVEWATSFRRIFKYLVPETLEIELDHDEPTAEAPDEAAPETVFRTYEQRTLEDCLELFDDPSCHKDSFFICAQFCRYPFAVGFGARSGSTREQEVMQALRSWLCRVERFSLAVTIPRPTAHVRLALARGR